MPGSSGGDPGSGSSGGNLFGGGSISGTFNAIGGAVTDLYAAEGDRAEARNYDSAETFALQEAQFTESSTRIKEMQASRQIQQATGAIEAGTGGNGLAMSGSAQDVLRESAQQGALTQGAIQFQGAETEQGYREQATSYSIMADAARGAARGADIGAAIQGVTAVANIASMAASL